MSSTISWNRDLRQTCLALNMSLPVCCASVNAVAQGFIVLNFHGLNINRCLLEQILGAFEGGSLGRTIILASRDVLDNEVAPRLNAQQVGFELLLLFHSCLQVLLLRHEHFGLLSKHLFLLGQCLL